MTIKIFVHVDDEQMFTVEAPSFDIAHEKLGKVERRVRAQVRAEEGRDVVAETF